MDFLALNLNDTLGVNMNISYDTLMNTTIGRLEELVGIYEKRVDELNERYAKK